VLAVIFRTWVKKLKSNIKGIRLKREKSFRKSQEKARSREEIEIEKKTTKDSFSIWRRYWRCCKLERRRDFKSKTKVVLNGL